jgi:hypothetical protein
MHDFVSQAPDLSVVFHYRLCVALGAQCALRGQQEMYKMTRGMFVIEPASPGKVRQCTVCLHR